MNINGQCLCGAVKLSGDIADPETHACHCQMCQRWFGGPALGVAAASIEFSGNENISTYDSSEWAERGFCNRCGSNLFYRLKAQNQYILFTGTFDDPSPFKLTGEIFIDSKPDSYDFAGDHKRLTGEEFWQSLQQPS